VELQRKLHGEDTEKLADSLNNLGVALLKAGRADEALTIYGDGKQVRDALHIADVVDLLIKQSAALASERRPRIAGQAYNVGGGYQNTISLLELCDRWGIRPSFSEWRPADQKVFYCDVGKAKELFDWSPRVSLDEGLAELYRWTEVSQA